MEVNRSDLQKIGDVLEVAVRHHKARDHMNAALHLATEPRWSPLTSELEAARDRVADLVAESYDEPEKRKPRAPARWVVPFLEQAKAHPGEIITIVHPSEYEWDQAHSLASEIRHGRWADEVCAGFNACYVNGAGKLPVVYVVFTGNWHVAPEYKDIPRGAKRGARWEGLESVRSQCAGANLDGWPAE